MEIHQAEASAPIRTAAVADRLHATAIHLLRRLRREDNATGLSTAQLSALSVLVFEGPQTLGALAATEQVRPPTTSRLVDNLERRGLAIRERDAQDRRVVRVRPTEAGRHLLQEGRHRRVDVLARQLDTLSPEDRATLNQASLLLEQLLRTPW